MSPISPHDDEHRPPQLSDRDRAMVQEIARHTGQHVVARIIDLAQDEAVIERVSAKWSREAQRVVGAAVIRFVFWVVGIVALIVAWKTGLVGAISDAIGSNGGHK
mgnify:CR=1 FL=1